MSRGLTSPRPLLIEEDEMVFDLEARVRETLHLLGDWGQAATLKQLSKVLIGGRVDAGLLRTSLPTMESIRVRGGMVWLEGSEELIQKTTDRLRAHGVLGPTFLEVAREFTGDLVRWCPFVRCVALTGSLASGGFDEGDDIDLDLFVETGRKYTTYLIANLLGLKYAWRYRHREVDAVHRTPFLPKLTCVNVLWTEEEARPFVRQDLDMAFELLRCHPLYGHRYFSSVLGDNPWLRAYFPQIHEEREWEEVETADRPGIRVFALLKRLRLLGWVERWSRRLTWVLYRYVQWSRRHNPEAMTRLAYLQRVKWPYEVFQD